MKKLKLILLAMLAIANAHAQKLPKVQMAGVRAPGNIKIDGMATEWNDKFRAYNSGQHIYYTLSNDDNNLYLTARMDDMTGDIKIFKGGLTFTIIPLVKTKDKISVTFPVVSRKKRDAMENGSGSHFILYRDLKSDTIANKAKIESLIAASNSEITKNFKEIYVTGIPEISDTFLSINNIQGILAGAGFDKKMRYTYELAIPISYLEAALSNKKSIKYNIRLNAEPIDAVKRPPPRPGIALVDPNARPFNMDELFSLDNTDFSGEYTIANKP